MFDSTFWLAVSFAIFLGLFLKYVFPFITGMIDSSAKKVAEDIKKAENLKKEAEKLLLDAKKYYKDTVQYCDNLVKDTKAEIKTLQDKAKETLDLEIKTKTEAAIARVKTQEERAIREVKQSLINEAVQKVRQDFSGSEKKANDNFIKQSLQDISKF